MQRECTCAICGTRFIAGRKGAMFCSQKCRYEHHKEYSLEWYHSHKPIINERQNERRAKKRRPKKEDTIVAIGYAERQMAKTLDMVGKINVEL